MRRSFLALAALAACKTTTPEARADAAAASNAGEAKAYVASLREEYAALGHVQAVIGWYSSTQGEPSVSSLTYVGHDRLFARRALQAVAEVRKDAKLPANEALALTFLTRSLTGDGLSLSLAKFDDEYNDAEAGATVQLPWKAGPVAYRDVQALLSQEPDAGKRAQAFAAMNAVRAGRLNPILARKEEAAQAAARETVYADYVALSEELRQVKLRPLLDEGIVYVRATDELYKKTLDRVAREELGIPREKLRVADVGRLWRAPGLAKYFDSQLELPTLRAFLGGIGLDLHTSAGTEVLVDDGQNPKKQPRAFVNPIDAPRDVRLSVKPAGGLSDYETLFHEAGHAVHFANVDVHPDELILHGYGAPSEAFGEFFRHGFSDPRWLSRYADFLAKNGKPTPGKAELAAIQRRLALREMNYIRRYAFAKIAYELRLHGRPAAELEPALAMLPDRPAAERDLKSLYKQLLSVANAFELSDDEAESYRSDVDDTFYSADYARAFVLAGMMHDGMRKKFGDDWYGNPAVGKFLRAELFAPGTSLSPEDVAQKMGFAHQLDFKAAAARAKRLLAEADALETSH